MDGLVELAGEVGVAVEALEGVGGVPQYGEVHSVAAEESARGYNSICTYLEEPGLAFTMFPTW
jgi:phosphoenolpyruvate carboxylase